MKLVSELELAMFDYTVRFYDRDGKISALRMTSAESDLGVCADVKQQLADSDEFQSAEVLRDGSLLKTIIK